MLRLRLIFGLALQCHPTALLRTCGDSEGQGQGQCYHSCCETAKQVSCQVGRAPSVHEGARRRLLCCGAAGCDGT